MRHFPNHGEDKKPNLRRFNNEGEPVQVTPDLYALGLFLEIMFCIPLFLIASLLLVTFIDFVSHRLGTLLRYLAFPGVVLHEICHDILCRITGIPILKHRIFIGNRNGVVGGVVVEASKIRTFTTSVLIGFAPLIILALALYLLIAFWVIIPMHEILKYYFAFCFFIGLAPSKADIKLVTSVAKERPNQTILELGLLSIPLLTGLIYLFFRPLWALPFSIWLFSGAVLAGALLALLFWQVFKPHRNS